MGLMGCPRAIKTAVLVLITIITSIDQGYGNHVCNSNDLTAFCLITRQFKEIVNAANPPAYPQFSKLIQFFPKEAFQTYSAQPLPNPLTTTIFTFQDVCEIENVLADFSSGAKKGTKNPFRLEVTEIHVKKARLHNWLHIKITSDAPTQSGATGKIKMGFIIAHDQNSYPVGDFNHQLPCGSDCSCKYYKPPRPGTKQCVQGSRHNHVPCMFTNDKVVTHPGQMMFYDEEGVEEIHATWHFAQHQDNDLFISELHFKALLVEDPATVITMTGVDREASNPVNRKGIFGWNPVYRILHPTAKTVGGWDLFRQNVYAPKDIRCHEPLQEEYFPSELYPTMGDKLNFTADFAGATALSGARNNDYSAKDSGEQAPQAVAKPPNVARLYWGTTNPGVGAFKDDIKFRPSVEGLHSLEVSKLTRLIPISPALLETDRCVCSMIPTTLPPQEVPPPIIQIQGRQGHAIQMIMAWLVLVPFGIFVSRYYKETYSKVFFLQEYWWFSIHVMCMGAAAMFMYGGIYAMEIKRLEPFQWRSEDIVVHSALGFAAMAMFTIHIPLGFFRFKILEARLVQIMMHWLFGNLEYCLAIACMISSGSIVHGCMPCSAVAYLVFWVLVQGCFFVGMELHMRDIDKQLMLVPKRSYLPPPVMRVFHENAPESKFRIYVLLTYAGSCMFTFFAVYLLIKFNDDEGQSCFHKRIIEEKLQ